MQNAANLLIRSKKGQINTEMQKGANKLIKRGKILGSFLYTPLAWSSNRSLKSRYFIPWFLKVPFKKIKIGLQVPIFEVVWCQKPCDNYQCITRIGLEYISLENIINDFLFPRISSSKPYYYGLAGLMEEVNNVIMNLNLKKIFL